MFPAVDTNRLSVVMGLAVTVATCAGPAWAQNDWQPTQRPRMPALVGLPRAQAEKALSAVGVASFSVAFVPGAEPGLVVRQFPEAGVAVARASLYVGVTPPKMPQSEAPGKSGLPPRPRPSAWWFFVCAQPLLLLWVSLEKQRRNSA